MYRKPYVLGDYKVGKRIAAGGFGEVHGGKTPDGERVAMKFERTYDRIKRPYLKHEADVYRLLSGNPCIPHIYAYGREERCNVMVFDLLGNSLQSLFDKCGERFSLKTTLMLAPQIIECIEYCHSKGIIHRDIKPDNLLMGRGDRDKFVHIIDFGLSRRYRHPKTLEHFPYFEGHSFFGTTRYASLNALDGRSQSRRDDLESAAYTLIYFMRKRLPWQGLRGGTDKHRERRVREKKRTWTPERLCEGLPEELAKMLAYVKGLGYTDEPDYAYLKGLFTDRLKKEGFELDYDYDWLHVPARESDDDSSDIASRSSSSKESQAADDEAEEDHRKDAGSAVGKAVRLSSRGTLDSGKVDSSISSLSKVDDPTKGKSVAQNPTGSSKSALSRSGKPEASDSIASQSSKVETQSHDSDSLRSEESSDTPDKSESLIKKGDFVLVKFLPRVTLEADDSMDSSDAPIDNSYWHDPSLSKDEWHFPYRAGVVVDIESGSAYCRLYLLPIMQRPDGLAKVSPARRPAFVEISTKEEEKEKVSESNEDGPIKVQSSPAWPRDGTYAHHEYDLFRILVPADQVKNVKVVWRLDEEQLKRLVHARDNVMNALNNDSYLSDAGSETEEVRRRQRRRRAMVHYPVYGNITSLTEEALENPDVDLTSSNGWLYEYFKTDRRRSHENGCYTGDSDYSMDEENLSMYTGPTPCNRRLSCTLAIDGDVIVEAASVAGSDRESRSSRYRSPSQSSFVSSYRSRGTSMGSRQQSREHARVRKTGSRANSVAVAKSLRHAVLDSSVRSACNSPTRSSQMSVSSAGSSVAITEDRSVGSSDASLATGSTGDSNESVRAGSGDSSYNNTHYDSSALPSRAGSDAGISGGSSVSSIAGSIVGSAAGSVASLARSFTEALLSSNEGEGSQNASSAPGKIAIDDTLKVEDRGELNLQASAAKGREMLDKCTQTEERKSRSRA